MNRALFTRLRADAEKSPVYHAVIVILLGVGFASLPLYRLFPGTFGGEGNSLLFWGGLLRLIIAGAGIVLAFGYGFGKQFKGSAGVTAYLLLIPALLAMVNNFPFIGFFGGGAEFTADATGIALFIFYCFSVAAFEEVFFRGIAFPLVFKSLENTRRPVFYSVAASSALFAAAHLVNLFSGSSIGAVAMQTGYSFLIGALCAISLITVKNVYVPIAFHFIYDVGGLWLDGEIGVASALQWDTVTVIITAVLGVIVAVYMLILLLKTKKERVYCTFGILPRLIEKDDKGGENIQPGEDPGKTESDNAAQRGEQNGEGTDLRYK